MKITIHNVVKIVKKEWCIIVTERHYNPVLSDHQILLRDLESIKVYKDKLNRQNAVITFK